MENNICKNCHLENPENAKYCHSCGKEIILPDQKTIAQESKNKKLSNEKNPFKKHILISIIIVIILVIGMVVFCGYYSTLLPSSTTISVSTPTPTVTIAPTSTTTPIPTPTPTPAPTPTYSVSYTHLRAHET